MRTPKKKHVISFLIVFVGALVAIVGLFTTGEITPLEMGYFFATACFTAIVVLTLLLNINSDEAHDCVNTDDSKRTLRIIRNYKIVIAVMPLLFAYALWSTKGDSSSPRIIGAGINAAITSVFIVALRAQKAKLNK